MRFSGFLSAGLVASLFLSTAPAIAGVADFDSSAEFGDTQGAAGWLYGYYATPGDADSFRLLEYRQDLQAWTHEGRLPEKVGKHMLLGQDTMQPSWNSGRHLWTVRRWTSGVAGELGLSGSFLPDGAGTARLHVIVDGVRLWSAVSRPGGEIPLLSTRIDAGSTVDFAIDAFDFSDRGDLTWLQVTGSVTGAAEPAAMQAAAVPVPSGLLLCAGGLGALGLARRQRPARA